MRSKPPKKGKKQAKCRICHQRPVWNYKNSPGDVCKRCYHRHIWSERPSVRKEVIDEIDLETQLEEFGSDYGLSPTDANIGYSFERRIKSREA